MQTLGISDILSDESKDFNHIYQHDISDQDETENEETAVSLRDSHYFTETDFVNFLNSKQISDTNRIQIICLNIANLLSKLASFKIFLQNISNASYRPGLVALTETHLTDNLNHGYSDKDLANILPGYKFYFKNRKIRRGGGVGVFVREDLTSKVCIESEDLFEEEIFESITIRIPEISCKNQKKDMVIVTVYRQPGNENVALFQTHMETWLHRYNKRTEEIFVVGDMNLDLLNYQSHAPTANYLDTMISNAMIPLITKPTRIKHGSATLIDHVFCRLPGMDADAGILCTEIAGSHGFTDHYPVFCLDDELASLNDYFCANKLKLNASKTQLVCFRKKGQNFDSQNIPVKIDNQSLNFTDHVTFLGLILDEHLTWENHCNNVANKIARTCGVLNRVKKVLPLHSLLAIYHSLVQSHYSYGLEVWGASSAKSIKRINILQKKSIRSVTRAHWLAHSEPRLKKLEILKIADQHKLQTVSLVYDMLRGYSPDIFNFQLSLNINQNDINLRSSVAQPNNLRPPHSTRMSDQKFFSHCAIDNWNSLPNEIKQCSSRKSFKSSAKKHFLSTYLTECNCINPLCIDLLHHSD